MLQCTEHISTQRSRDGYVITCQPARLVTVTYLHRRHRHHVTWPLTHVMASEAADVVTSPGDVVNDTASSVFGRYSWVGLLAVHGPTALQVSQSAVCVTYKVALHTGDRITHCTFSVCLSVQRLYLTRERKVQMENFRSLELSLQIITVNVVTRRIARRHTRTITGLGAYGYLLWKWPHMDTPPVLARKKSVYGYPKALHNTVHA